jgi:hypothetical protein
MEKLASPFIVIKTLPFSGVTKGLTWEASYIQIDRWCLSGVAQRNI